MKKIKEMSEGVALGQPPFLKSRALMFVLALKRARARALGLERARSAVASRGSRSKKFRRAFFDRKKFLPSSQFIRAIESGSTAVVVASSRKTSASLVQLGVGTVENQM